MRQKEKRRRLWVTVYAMTLVYGGPEEGGWYWDRLEPVESCRAAPRHAGITRKRLLAKHDDLIPRDRHGGDIPYHSVNGGFALVTYYERTAGQWARTRRPHYE